MSNDNESACLSCAVKNCDILKIYQVVVMGCTCLQYQVIDSGLPASSLEVPWVLEWENKK